MEQARHDHIKAQRDYDKEVRIRNKLLEDEEREWKQKNYKFIW
jgi:hypothetical protein